MAIDNKNSTEFWIFSLDDPELYHFYTAQANNTSLYYTLCIEECLEDFTSERRNIMHLRNKCILLIDSYLVPVFCQLPLKGYLIVVTESFCELDIHKALLKLVFFHNTPEGVRDLGNMNDMQEKCISLVYKEYHNAPDDLQIPIIRSLIINLYLLSTETNYDKPMKVGHLLNYALQFMDLINEYASREKKKSFYAEKIGITEKVLTHALQAIFNRSFRELLMYKILIDAMKKLVFTDNSVTQIAHELNYDASGFNKLFLKWKGMYPKDLRVNYRKLVEHVEYNY
ncbi:MAG: helix-turn-helix domain-containing protein [Prevotellaceae bacterium]|nr:helix-turn-helix domain-containing protein [Prevotellaceae bacterium]